MTEVLLILVFVFLLIVVGSLAMLSYMQQHLINTLNKRLIYLLARTYDALGDLASASVAQVNERADGLEGVINLNEEFTESQFDPFEAIDDEDLS
jgi:hypothetical protein